MAYTKSNSAGATRVATGSSGAGTAASMPNYGTSVITSTTAGDAFVLQPPVQGCRKRIIFATLSTANVQVVMSCTSGGDDITIVGATTGINAITVNTARVVTTPVVVDLEGFNSTSWVITGVCPQTSLLSITLSSA